MVMVDEEKEGRSVLAKVKRWNDQTGKELGCNFG